MKNKIKADSWFIMCLSSRSEPLYIAKIDYKLADESNSKSHQFATFQEAYQWIKNQVIL